MGQPPSLWSVGADASALGTGVTGGVAMSAPEGGGDTGNNTHLWVAGVMTVALIGIVFLHISGFRFATDVGVTRG